MIFTAGRFFNLIKFPVQRIQQILLNAICPSEKLELFRQTFTSIPWYLFRRRYAAFFQNSISPTIYDFCYTDNTFTNNIRFEIGLGRHDNRVKFAAGTICKGVFIALGCKELVKLLASKCKLSD